MKRFIPQILKKFINDKSKGVFIASLLIAFVFWLLFSLGEKYTTYLNFRVVYENYPDDKTILSPLPEQVRLKVESNGWNLLRVKIFRKKFPIKINLESFIQQGKIKTSTLLNQIEFKKLNDFQIIYLYPETIELKSDTVITKTVPVLARVKIEYKPFYGPASLPVISPDYIEIKGPESYCSKIDTILTEEYHFTQVDKDIKSMLLLKIPYQTLVANPDKLLFEQKVSQYTEKTVKKSIDVKSVPSNVKVVLIPSSVKVSFQLPLDAYPLVDSTFVNAFVDISDTLESRTLKVNATISYPFIKNIQVNPSYVNYILIHR